MFLAEQGASLFVKTKQELNQRQKDHFTFFEGLKLAIVKVGEMI